MTAEVQKNGCRTAGFNKEGQFVESEVSLVVATVPGEDGDWMFVVKDNHFSWIKGLPEGQGYEEYTKEDYQLPEDVNLWGGLINLITSKGIPEEGDTSFTVKVVEPGSSTELSQERFFLVSK